MFLAFFASSLLSTASQQPNENTPYELDPVIVTDSQSPRLLSESPSAVEVVSKDMIENINASNLEEALRILPGLQLRDIHGKSGKGVYVQGLNSNRVLILIDGLPISSTTGSTVDTSQLGVVDIERIEFIKGASSALYGSAAMGAVVNVITRKQSKNSIKLGFKGSDFGKYQVEQGVLSEYRAYAQGVHSFFNGRMSISVDHRQSQGYDLTPESYSTSLPSGYKNNASVLFALPITDDNPSDEVFIKLDAYRENISRRILKKGDHKGRKQEQLNRNRLDFGANKTLNKHRLRFNYMHESQKDNSDQLHENPDLIAGNLWRESHYHQNKASLSWLYQPEEFAHAKAEFLIGAEFFNENLDQFKTETKLSNSGAPAAADITPLANGGYKIRVNEVNDAELKRYEIYSQAILPLSQQFQLTPGVRWQHDEKFGSHTSPKLNLLWSAASGEHRFQWRASYGLGYRVPDLKNRYFIFDHSINGYKVLGNENLKPEISHNKQLSAHYSYADDFSLNISLFHNRLHNLIEAQYSGKTEQSGKVAIYTYANTANAMSRGYEISSQWLSLSWLKQQISYSYLEAINLKNHTPLVLRSTHQFKLNWDIQLSTALSANINTQIESRLLTRIQNNQRHYSPTISQWYASLKYRPLDNLKLYTGIDNLFDQVRDVKNQDDRRNIKHRHVYAGIEVIF